MSETTPQKQVLTEEQLQKIRQLAQSVRYGSINLIVQDGILVQIERNEKIRVTNYK